MVEPAPWDLHGSGFLIMLRRSALVSNEQPPCGGRVSFLMCLDYEASPVGPYRELLWIPGQATAGNAITYTITDILVDSADSLESGRANWGIPKELGRLDWSRRNSRMEMVAGTDGFQGSAAVKAFGPTLPFSTRFFPLTFHQTLDGRTFSVRPKASGWVAPATVQALVMDGLGNLESLPRSAVLTAFFIKRFTMCFPKPEIQR